MKSNKKTYSSRNACNPFCRFFRNCLLNLPNTFFGGSSGSDLHEQEGYRLWMLAKKLVMINSLLNLFCLTRWLSVKKLVLMWFIKCEAFLLRILISVEISRKQLSESLTFTWFVITFWESSFKHHNERFDKSFLRFKIEWQFVAKRGWV